MSMVGSGFIGSGEAEYFDVVLRGGVPTGIYVEPADPTVDFDLYVYDENGNLVEKDNSTTSNALCMVTPRWTGPFRIKVTSHHGLSTYRIVVTN